MAREGDWDGQAAAKRRVRPCHDDRRRHARPLRHRLVVQYRGQWPILPRDAYFGSGAGHRILLVVPSLKLIVVRLGGELLDAAHMPKDYHDVYRQYLFEPLMAAMDKPATNSREQGAGSRGSAAWDGQPYPPSRVITGIQWARKESIVRRAPGGDNWPLTWADGDGFTPPLAMATVSSPSRRRS